MHLFFQFFCSATKPIFFVNFAKILRKIGENFDHFWDLNFLGRSRTSRQPQRFLPSRHIREKIRG